MDDNKNNNGQNNGSGTNNNNQNNNQGNNNGSQNNQGSQQNNGEGKRFTEQELETLLAEKRVSAKNEFLKSLGFDGDEDGLKETLKRVMEEDEKNQSELEKVSKALKKVSKALEIESEARKAAESKLVALKLGAKPETVDDLVILASAKATGDKDLNKVIGELKKSYPVYFKSDDEGGSGNSQDKGTKGHINNNNVNGEDNQGNNNDGSGNSNNGGNNGTGNNGGGKSSIAERLLANRKGTGKSSYFKNK